MPRLSQAEIRNNAISFVHEWKDETRERAESQTFWNEFLEIFGIKRRQVAVFEKAVTKNNQNTGAIDLFWRGVLLVEHKSLGKNFDKASSQAFEYLENLPEDDLPEYVLISDFATFRYYNLETKEELEFRLEELPDKIHLFGAISGYQKREYKEQDAVNIKVALKLGELHDALSESGYTGHKLEAFLVRLVYCLFADDTGIFLPRSSFLYFLTEKTAEDGSNLGAMLAQLFQVLDTPESERQSTLDEDLRAFPHVNGALFAERHDLPFFDRKMRRILIETCEFDWSKVSPAIFGSLFQSVMDAEKRRNLGAHYTSEKNILKVIHGLFLDELLAEYENVKNNLTKLRSFHDRIASLRFFDPACGCGNFLVITYREMRRLELAVLKQIRSLTGNVQGEMLVSNLSKIDVNSFYGIEVEEFPSEIARVALWLTDHLANTELSAEFGVPYFRLPLEHSPNIVYGNALRLDWREVVGEPNENLFILGNPPFVGSRLMEKAQKQDLETVFEGTIKIGDLDYVTGWYIKAAKLIQNTKTKVAFVSTNSIVQGLQTGILWSQLLAIYNIKIHFAHRTFKWSNEAAGNAAVYCVIIGFANFDVNTKRIFDYEDVRAEAHELKAKNINPYLIDAEDFLIDRKQHPICNVPEMNFGNMPADGGEFLFTTEEKTAFLRSEPHAERYFKPFISAYEFINKKERWCLWLQDVDPQELRKLRLVKERIEKVKRIREFSSRPHLALTPHLFAQITQPPGMGFILIPRHSSEKRRFIPIGFFDKSNIGADSCLIVPNGDRFHFGVLTSTMHNAWMRQVCGRLKSDYRYSKDIVYNNFAWPIEPTDKNRERVEQTAQAILDARLKFPDATLADLYDPLTMPKELLDAHRANDEAVDACYGPKRFKNELERLEFLFDLYRQYTEPLSVVEAKEIKKSKRVKIESNRNIGSS